MKLWYKLADISESPFTQRVILYISDKPIESTFSGNFCSWYTNELITKGDCIWTIVAQLDITFNEVDNNDWEMKQTKYIASSRGEPHIDLCGISVDPVPELFIVEGSSLEELVDKLENYALDRLHQPYVTEEMLRQWIRNKKE